MLVYKIECLRKETVEHKTTQLIDVSVVHGLVTFR